MAAVLPYLPVILQGVAGMFGNLSGADAAKNNAKAAKAEGEQAAQLGELKAAQISRQNRLLSEKQFAGYAGSGVDPTQGSPLDVMTQDAVQGELNALMASYEGRAAQQSLEYESKQYKFQAKQDRIRAVFDPAGIVIKSAGIYQSKKVAPTIEPGGGGASSPGGSFDKGYYNAPDLNAKDIFR